MQQQETTVEGKLARIARASHGVVTRAQLLVAGISEEEIRQRIGRGSLIRQHRGVYRVGHQAPSIEATYLAAVRACGERALLSGRAAAYLFGLLGGLPAPPPEVTAAVKRRVSGIRVRRSSRIGADEATTWRRIPVTTVPCTLVDLAAQLPPDDLARACHEAAVRYSTTPTEVEAVLARRPKTPGAGELRRVLRGEARVTLSKLEARFLAHLRAAGLPLPQTNRLVDGRRVDCRWPQQRLTVELDGYRYHHSRHAWEQDRRREREARARGDGFRRYTYGDVFEDPTFMLAELRSLLA